MSLHDIVSNIGNGTWVVPLLFAHRETINMDGLNLKKFASDAGTLFTRAKQVRTNTR